MGCVAVVPAHRFCCDSFVVDSTSDVVRCVASQHFQAEKVGYYVYAPFRCDDDSVVIVCQARVGGAWQARGRTALERGPRGASGGPMHGTPLTRRRLPQPVRELRAWQRREGSIGSVPVHRGHHLTAMCLFTGATTRLGLAPGVSIGREQHCVAGRDHGVHRRRQRHRACNAARAGWCLAARGETQPIQPWCEQAPGSMFPCHVFAFVPCHATLCCVVHDAAPTHLVVTVACCLMRVEYCSTR